MRNFGRSVNKFYKEIRKISKCESIPVFKLEEEESATNVTRLLVLYFPTLLPHAPLLIESVLVSRI